MNTKKRNVILYCRVSSDEQKLNTSLSHQEETLSEYCRKMGYNVVNIYKDDFSAKSRYLNRPKLKEAYEYCRKHKGEVDLLLFLRWDRFARHVGFAFDYKEKFEAQEEELKKLKQTISTLQNQLTHKNLGSVSQETPRQKFQEALKGLY